MSRPQKAPPYVPLWCKSNYSFLEGASHPHELVETAANYGLPALALTDRDGVYGVVRGHVAARPSTTRLIVGSEITLFDGSTLVLLAASRNGYGNLCDLIACGRLRSPKGESRVHIDEVCDRADGLMLLWGGKGFPNPDRLREAFDDRMLALLARHSHPTDLAREHHLRRHARHLGIPVVAACETLYHHRNRQGLHDVVTCIRHHTTLSEAGTRTRANAEHTLHDPTYFAHLYADDPAALHRTCEVAERCAFSLDDIHYRYPSERLPDGGTSAEQLRHHTFDGARQRFPQGLPDKVRHQINQELALIHELEYEGYFLTMRELVQFCRRANILCQGRGSAANSAVCYCLGVTAVDPSRTQLLFERFISRERAEPPDIDLDIEHNRREEVIQHVYEKYGRSHSAMVANFIRYRRKSALRDVGKVLGFQEVALERIVRHFAEDIWADPKARSRDDIETNTGLNRHNPLHQHLIRLALEIQNAPRHLSIHPGGFLLGHEPIHRLVPTENATMPDRTVIQWDKEDVEDMKLFKVDLLGLGALNVVHRTFDLVTQHTGTQLDLADIPPRDPDTYAMIQRADTVGVFQIESRAQMSMLPRLKPRHFYDLVIQVSIVRPGPISGNMVHPYLRRRNGEEAITYPHSCLEPVLKRTLGIPLFQEQVMELAMVAADYTPGEADQLRRDMAAWRMPGRIERHRSLLIERMTGKGIAEEFAERVFEQILGFGEYGFPESHAASFALIVYSTSWLKCHYPAAYLCAMLNAQPMGFYSASTLIADATRHGVVTRPIDVSFSAWDCTLEPDSASTGGFAVRMGLRFVKGFHKADGEVLLGARPQSTPPFASLDDLTARTGLAAAVLARLAEAGALASLETGRRTALWHTLGTHHLPEGELPLPANEHPAALTPLPDAAHIEWDYQTASHSTRGHPLAHLRDTLNRHNFPDATTVSALPHDSPAQYAGMVICRQRPGSAKGVMFMTLEDETGWVNLVLWKNVFAQYRILAKTESFLAVKGTIQSEAGVVHLVAEHLWIPQLDQAPAALRSRNFH